MPRTSDSTTYLGLDIGTRRIGVSIADGGVSIARPLTTLEVDESVEAGIGQIARDSFCTVIVVGYPRNQSGDATAQTGIVEACVERLRLHFDGTIVYQDESLTSVVAEERLKTRGGSYTRGDIDAEAACIILTDYLELHHA